MQRALALSCGDSELVVRENRQHYVAEELKQASERVKHAFERIMSRGVLHDPRGLV